MDISLGAHSLFETVCFSKDSKQTAVGSDTMASSEGGSSELNKGRYVELDDIHGLRSSDAAKTQLTYEIRTMVVGGDCDGDVERGVVGMGGMGGIKRTTTVEQYRY